MVRRGWLVGLFVSLALFVCPSAALAEDASLIDSLAGGLSDTVTGETRSVEDVDPVRDYEYEPVLREVETRAVEEESTQSAIERVTNAFNRLNWGESSSVTLFSALRLFLGGASSSVSPVALFLPVAAGLCFMWWGVRRAISMLMAAFTRGRMTVGGSGGRESVAGKNSNKYLYGRYLNSNYD